jgi:hypothetical protein
VSLVDRQRPAATVYIFVPEAADPVYHQKASQPHHGPGKARTKCGLPLRLGWDAYWRTAYSWKMPEHLAAGIARPCHKCFGSTLVVSTDRDGSLLAIDATVREV